MSITLNKVYESSDHYGYRRWGYLRDDMTTVIIEEKMVSDYRTVCDHFSDCWKIERGREYGDINFQFDGEDYGHFNSGHIINRIEAALTGYHDSLDNPYDYDEMEAGKIITKIFDRVADEECTLFYVDHYGNIRETDELRNAEYIALYTREDFRSRAEEYEHGELVYAVASPAEAIESYEPEIEAEDFFSALAYCVGINIYDWEWVDHINRWKIDADTMSGLIGDEKNG